MYDKIYRKEYKDEMKILAILSFSDFNFYIKITNPSELSKDPQNKT